MGDKRTSMKDVAAKLDTLIDLMTSQASQAEIAAPSEAPDSPTTEGQLASQVSDSDGTVKVDEKYLAHMTPKAAEHATTKGEEVVLYARRNGRGETKLAYALRSRYDDVVAKQPSCLGAVASFKP